MVLEKPAPFVRAFVDVVDEAMREHHPGYGPAMQRTWLAFCVTAILVTNSICWARFERASLGTYALAALSWMFRHSKIPWESLLVVSVRVILHHYGLTSGSLVLDDTDNQRSKSAKTLAHLYKLRDKESGGSIWGQSLVFLVLVTPKFSIPVGFGGCNRSLPKSLCRPLPILQIFSCFQRDDRPRLGRHVPLMDLFPNPTSCEHPQGHNHLAPCNRPGHFGKRMMGVEHLHHPTTGRPLQAIRSKQCYHQYVGSSSRSFCHSSR